MSYFKQIAEAISYIESNLKEKFTLLDVALTAGLSLYHFHRIFSYGIGDSLRDYIRKRRLTEAANDLVYTNKSIISIAIDYCYESQESFSRAFYREYNNSPKKFRKAGLFYPVREKLSNEYLKMEISKRFTGISPTIIIKDSFSIIGKRITIGADENSFKVIPLFWQKFCNLPINIDFVNIKEDDSIYGISRINKDKTMDYIIGYKVDHNITTPKDYFKANVPSSKYACFTTSAPLTESVQKTQEYIWGTWLLGSEYKYAGGVDIEHYYQNQGLHFADVCIPIF